MPSNVCIEPYHRQSLALHAAMMAFFSCWSLEHSFPATFPLRILQTFSIGHTSAIFGAWVVWSTLEVKVSSTALRETLALWMVVPSSWNTPGPSIYTSRTAGPAFSSSSYSGRQQSFSGFLF